MVCSQLLSPVAFGYVLHSLRCLCTLLASRRHSPYVDRMLIREIVCHSLVRNALHVCRAASCCKPRRPFCRFGFWHWEELDAASCSGVWARVPGCSLCLRAAPAVSTRPFDFGAFDTVRHHPWMTRVSFPILLARKCNHDVGILWRVSPPSRDDVASTQDILARISAAVRTVAHYVTAYTSKVQPQIQNLWNFLACAVERLDAETSSAASEPVDSSDNLCPDLPLPGSHSRKLQTPPSLDAGNREFPSRRAGSVLQSCFSPLVVHCRTHSRVCPSHRKCPCWRAR